MPHHRSKKPQRGFDAAVGAMSPNAPWALDFQFDTAIDGRTIKLLGTVDGCTGQFPAVVVDRSVDADRLIACREWLIVNRAAPAFIRFGNYPEFIAIAVADWCRFSGLGTCFIDSGSPWRNS